MVLVLRHKRKGEVESSGAAAAVADNRDVAAAVVAAVVAVAAMKLRRVMGVDIMLTMTFCRESRETGIFVAGDPRATGSSQYLIFAVIQELGSRSGPVLFCDPPVGAKCWWRADSRETGVEILTSPTNLFLIP